MTDPARYFHFSATELAVGTVLVPGHRDSPWSSDFYPADQKWRRHKVWMFDSAASAVDYGGSPVVYEVRPVGAVGVILAREYSGDDEDLDAGIAGNQYYADAAIVIAKQVVRQLK